jgi:antitoxin component YwqK of YwqJK toxin-antitoxin module
MKKFIIFLLIFTSSCTPSECPQLAFDSANIITYDSNEKLFTGRCSTYENDSLRSVRQYLNGKDYGKWTFYFSNGNKETTGKFNKTGGRIGKWKYYYSNGKLKQISTFSNNGDELKGRWVTYDSIGNITSDINY